MKITVDDQLFDTIPGLCIGVVALRAADNRDVNLEAEAFRRRCCTEANLLLKMNPHIADQEIERYQNVLKSSPSPVSPVWQRPLRNTRRTWGSSKRKRRQRLPWRSFLPQDGNTG